MKFLLLGVFYLAVAACVLAQCPVLPRHAFLEANGANVAIRYYNSGGRAVQAVEFTLTRPPAGKNEAAVIARYAARQTLHSKVEKTAVFRHPAGEADVNEAAQVEALEVA